MCNYLSTDVAQALTHQNRRPSNEHGPRPVACMGMKPLNTTADTHEDHKSMPSNWVGGEGSSKRQSIVFPSSYSLFGLKKMKLAYMKWYQLIEDNKINYS